MQIQSSRAALPAGVSFGIKPHPVTGFPSRVPVRNGILAALPAEELALLQQQMEMVWLEQRTPLLRPDEPISHVYFPETAVISLVNTFADGTAVEVGTTGCEGMVGLTLFLAAETSSVTAFAQIPGMAGRIRADAFLELAKAPGTLHQMLLRYADAFLAQVAQTAACNATHLVQERCARWLLMTHDRVDRDTLPLTQEFLAFMLGVRRAGVSVVMHTLQEEGVVSYSRGDVRVLDRARLEAVSCECYRAVRGRFDRLRPETPTTVVLSEA